MKLTLVTETFPPEVNGVAMTLERLCLGMAARHHTVQVIRPRQMGDDDRGREGPLDHLTVPGVPLPRYKGLRMGLPVLWTLGRAFMRSRPDVVHIATEGPLGLAALMAARRLGLPVTSSFHTNFHTYGRHYGYGLLIRPVTAYLRWFHNHTAFTMTPSHDAQASLQVAGFNRVIVVGRGIDTAQFSPTWRDASLRQQWGAGEHDPVAMYVGRVAAEKNVPLVVEAVEAMQRIAPRLRFVIVGDGPARAALEKRHPDFVYAGMCRGEQLARHYASADVFLFASTTETFGNVITEAMASGLAVLTYDYAAGREHVRDGVNGHVVPLGDSTAFVARAGSIIQSPNAWPAMRQAARDTALTLSWDSIVDQFEAMLTRAAVSPEA